MNTKRLRRIGYFVLGVVLALISPIDEILIMVAVSTILYRFVRRKYGQYTQARALGQSRIDHR